MKRLALLVALAAMLCGTEAGAATIGFNDFTPGDPFGGVDADSGFTIAGNGGDFSIVGASGNNHASSGESGSSFLADFLPGDVVTEFSAQGLDLLSVGGESTFTIAGILDRDDPGTELFRFTFNIAPGDTFNRILLENLTPTFGTYTVDTKVERLVISVVHDANVTAGVDCIHVAGGSNNCTSGGDPNGTVPEPASLLLLGAGLAGIGIWRRKAAKLG